ncbi:MAG TPA: sec-independent translocase [Candidatus Nanopelagicaceae bacterium]
MFFDIGGGEIIALAILGLILVGPDRLPKLASDAALLVRRIQRLSQAATKELRENLGPGFEDLQPADLHPKTFLRKQLADALEQVDAAAKPVAKIDPDLL